MQDVREIWLKESVDPEKDTPYKGHDIMGYVAYKDNEVSVASFHQGMELVIVKLDDNLLHIIPTEAEYDDVLEELPPFNELDDALIYLRLLDEPWDISDE